MNVNSRVNINSNRIRQLSNAAVKALEKTGETLHTEVLQAQVVPRRDGTLQGEQFFVDYSDSSKGKVSLVHHTAYARRMYYHPEYNFSKAENPNAQGKWFEPWINGDKKDFCKDAFKQFYRMESGL